MNNKPVVSVIVPCYNQAQYLDECLQSILDQTFDNWECIIVNDGSPDNTDEIVKKWLNKDSRFNYIKKENGGLSSARNTGIEIAKGEWILPLDSDDKIGNKYFELAQNEFHKDYSVIYCQAEFFGAENSLWNLKDYSYQKLLTGNMIFCSAFYKKDVWKKSGGYDTNLIYGREDWEFWINILDKKSKVLKLNYLGFYYRRKNNSMDVEINKNLDKRIYSENYIYKKHLNKYLIYNQNPIDNYKITFNKLNEMNSNNNKINKNIITRILFKIIKIIS